MEETNFLEIEQQLEKYGTYATNTIGVSMQPLFKTHRDVIAIKRVSGELKKYDVVLYRARDKYILHRIIEIRDKHYVIRGDNTYAKEYVPKDRVIGVMVSFNRRGKHHMVDEKGYKFYSRFWNLIYPIRKACFHSRCFFNRVKRKLFRRKKGEKPV